MPTIDTETFQFVVLALVGLIALLGLLGLLQLSGIRKALTDRSPAGDASGEPSEGPATESEPGAGLEPGGDVTEDRPLEGAGVLDAVAAEARGDTEAAEIARAQQAHQADQERQIREAQAAAGAAQEEPQEQPFERDGRWWFRRGAELLVYEEKTGQWVGAPPAQASEPQPATADASGGPHEEAAPATTQSEGAGGFPEEPGPFWKCPTCGAVNGSTATSCRMCFTQRPQGT